MRSALKLSPHKIFCMSPNTFHCSPKSFNASCTATLMLFSLFLYFLYFVFFLPPLSFAETICNPNVPPDMIPDLTSCNYALNLLHSRFQQCGSRNMVFSPSAQGPSVYKLPSIFVGAGPEYLPTSSTWCAILILWQPRSGSRPPRYEEDAFPFIEILEAAYRIRAQCLVGRPGYLPTIGREWIRPYQLVDVQFAGVWPEENASSAAPGVEEMTLYTADGTNSTFLADIWDQHQECGNLNIDDGKGNNTALQ